MGKIPLCLIGCGGMGHRHILAYKELEESGIGNIELMAVCDLNPQNADLGRREIERLFGRTPLVFTDIDEVVKHPDIAAVDIVTDPSVHHQVAVPVLEAGKHVLCEKPLGITIRACKAMIDAAEEAFGKLDILIANAGILRDKSFKNMDEDMWDVVVNVHLKGTYLTTKAAYDQMLEQGEGGRIVVTSSTSGLLGNFGQTNYGAAKAGIAGMARCLYLEGMKYGINVNILAPTALSRLTDDIMPDAVKDQIPPDRVSPAVVWLCSDDAKEVTGRTWLVSGNRVSMLAWNLMPIAQKDEAEGPWEVDEVGEAILATKDSWPSINPMRGFDL